MKRENELKIWTSSVVSDHDLISKITHSKPRFDHGQTRSDFKNNAVKCDDYCNWQKTYKINKADELLK